MASQFRLFWIRATILQKSFGQPIILAAAGFRPALGGCEQPGKSRRKAAAGKIACPTSENKSRIAPATAARCGLAKQRRYAGVLVCTFQPPWTGPPIFAPVLS